MKALIIVTVLSLVLPSLAIAYEAIPGFGSNEGITNDTGFLVASNTVYCSNCGEGNDDPDAEYCSGCGKKLLAETSPASKFCVSCGSELDTTTRYCPECGTEAGKGVSGTRSYEKQGPRKSGGVAFALSFLITGGGQFYNGQVFKGAAMLGGYVGCVVAAVLLMEESYGYYYYDEGFGAASYGCLAAAMGIWVYSMIDAPLSAGRINRERGYAINIGEDGKYGNIAMVVNERMGPSIAYSVSF